MPIDASELETRPRGSGTKGVLYFRKADGKQVCGSQLPKRPPGVRCAIANGLGVNGRCRQHGRYSGRPPIHGRYSQRLGKLRLRFQEHLDAADILSATPDLALMDTAIETLLERAIGDGEGLKFREESLKLYREMRERSREGDNEGAAESLNELGKLLARGVDEARALNEAVLLSDRRAARAQKERDLEIKKERTVTEAQLVASYVFLFELVRRNAPHDVAVRILDQFTASPVCIAGEEANRLLEAGPT